MRNTLQLYRKQQHMLKLMPDERKTLIWWKYFFLALIVGAVAEIQSVVAGVFYYKPWWLIVAIIVVVWGGILGFVAKTVRLCNQRRQFLIGFIVSFVVTYFDFRVSHIKSLPNNELLGVGNVILQTTFFAASAGVLILVVNFLMKQFYKRKLRLG